MEKLDALLMALDEETYGAFLDLLALYVCDRDFDKRASAYTELARFGEQLGDGYEVDDFVMWWYWDAAD